MTNFKYYGFDEIKEEKSDLKTKMLPNKNLR